MDILRNKKVINNPNVRGNIILKMDSGLEYKGAINVPENHATAAMLKKLDKDCLSSKLRRFIKNKREKLLLLL